MDQSPEPMEPQPSGYLLSWALTPDHDLHIRFPPCPCAYRMSKVKCCPSTTSASICLLLRDHGPPGAPQNISILPRLAQVWPHRGSHRPPTSHRLGARPRVPQSGTLFTSPLKASPAGSFSLWSCGPRACLSATQKPHPCYLRV